MKRASSPTRLLGLALLCSLLLGGCATYRTERKADRLLADGHPAEGVQLLKKLADEDPEDYREKYLETRNNVTQRLLLEARGLRQQGRLDEALDKYRDILAYDPEHADAIQGLELIARDQREAALMTKAQASVDAGDADGAKPLLEQILAENPRDGAALRLRESIGIQQNQDALAEPTLKKSLRKPVSLEFRNASIQAVFEVLAQSSGINFIFDNDVKTDVKTTIYARQTSIEDALGLILRTAQLEKKVLNDSTLLIYPATQEKSKQYEDLIMRTFYLNSADPAKLADMIKTLVSPRYVYVDASKKMLVVRDNLRVIEAVERLIQTYDIPEPEVTLDVEILQVSSDAMLNIGLQYPNQISAHVTGAAGTAGELAAGEVFHLNRNNFSFTFPDPLAILNLQQTSAAAKTLANPSIRVRNHEKAKIMIGDKVPVVTNTVNASSSAISESISYLDVGVKLEVQPEIHIDNDVSMDVHLDVSSIVKQITTSTGLLTYEIGTSNAETILRLRDGETQALAGLIQNDDQSSDSDLPFLGKIPVLGWLFANKNNTHSKSEIVLLITPHVVRSLHTPSAEVTEFASGTGNEISTHALRLGRAGTYSTTRSELLDTPTAAPATSGSPAPSPAPADDAVVVFDPANADVRLELVAPAQIPANKDFTVALMSNGAGFDNMQLDLGFDQEMEVVNASPVIQAASFHWQPSAHSLHLDFGQAAAYSGPLAMITLRAKQAAASPANLVISHQKGKKANDVELLVSPPPSRALQITP